MAGSTAGRGHGELDVGWSFFVVVFVFLAVLLLETLDFFLEEELGADGGARDASGAVAVSLAVDVVAGGAGVCVIRVGYVFEGAKDAFAAAAWG